jgi:hypothetical protein
MGRDGSSEAAPVKRISDSIDPVQSYTSKLHPSVNLESRGRGFGIGGGYEEPYISKAPAARAVEHIEQYGPLPHAGYYGAGTASRPFGIGQAGFSSELEWYGPQYGEKTA